MNRGDLLGFTRSSRGSLNLELALITALLVIACVGALTFLGGSISNRLNNSAGQVDGVGAAVEEVHINYFLTDGAGTITGYDTAGSGVNEVIPASINGVPITAIAAGTSTSPYCLPGFGQLSGTLTFADGITSIGNYAFYNCSGLSGTLTLPAGLTSVGEDAFGFCSGLTGTLTFPSGFTSTGIYAFEGCSGLTGISFPTGLTSISMGAFANCSGLTSVDFPASLTSIGGSAFNVCSGLTGTLTLPDGLTTIGTNAFYGPVSVSGNNANFSTVDGVLFNKTGTTLVYYPRSRSGAYTIPETITSIGNYAFSNCLGLTSVDLPASLTIIGSSAFNSCSGLTTATLGTNVSTLGTKVFNLCSNLTVSRPAAKTTWTATFLGCYAVSTYGSVDTYTLTVSAGSNGTISPTTLTVNSGSNQSFAITPSTGYHIVMVFVDSTPVGPSAVYTLYGIAANHTITATFAIGITDTVSFNPNGGTPPGSRGYTINDGTSFGGGLPAAWFTKTGYTFNGWNTAADGSGSAFTLLTTVNGSLTVYAQWIVQ